MNTIAIITIKLDQRVNLNLGLKNGTDSTFQEQNMGSIFLLKKTLGKSRDLRSDTSQIN